MYGKEMIQETEGDAGSRARQGASKGLLPPDSFHYNSVIFWLRDHLLVEEPVIL